MNELARAGVRAMLGFERKRAVVQEPSSTAAAARLVCWSLSCWQFGAGVDDPHTGRKGNGGDCAERGGPAGTGGDQGHWQAGSGGISREGVITSGQMLGLKGR